MSDLNSLNFPSRGQSAESGEHHVLETDIEKLSKKIIEKKNLPEYKEISEKELIKQSLQPLIKPITQSTNDIKTQPITIKEEQLLPNYLKDSPVETKLQVEKLINSVFHQGIEKVIETTKQQNPFILDALHDALVDRLHEELKKRNLL